MANFKAPRVAWLTSRPADSTRGRLQGLPAAWPTCDLFRWWPSVSMRGKAPVLKSRRHRQDELYLPPLHST